MASKSSRPHLPTPEERNAFEAALNAAIGAAGAGFQFNTYARAIFVGLTAEHLAREKRLPSSLTLGELAWLASMAAEVHADRLATREATAGKNAKHP